MAAPSYTTDLVDINLVNTAGSTTNWTAIGGGASGLVAETDFYIQGDGCISKAGWSAGTKGMIYNGGSKTITSGDAVFMWLYFWGPTALAVETAGGLQVIIGNTTSAYRQWYVRGSDTYQFGGWICVPVDPTVAAEATTGSTTSTISFFGALANISGAITKGQPLGIDSFRYGRTLQVTNGDGTSGYGTFAGAATTDNNSGTNRWGLFQAIDGGYLHQGLFLMGTAGTTVDFRDSNRNIIIANTKKVGSAFNAYEVRNASSRVDWTNISITALGTTSRGNFITTHNADINFDSCIFTDMGTFGFQSNSTILTSTFRRCSLVTQSSAVFTGCTFDSTNDSVKAILSNNPGNISGCTFISSGTKHAIEISTAGTYSFDDNNFTGYATTDGSTGNEVIYNNSGGAVTLNVSGSGTVASLISVRNGSGASTTVNQSVNLTVTVNDESNNPVESARVAIYKSSDMTELLNTTTNASGIATTTFNYPGTTVPVIIRVRKSSATPKYIPVVSTGTISSTGLDTTITFVADTIAGDTTNGTIAGDFTINTTRKTIKHTADSVIYSVNELYTWLMDYFDDSGLMDDTAPMSAQTPEEYTLINGWFMDDESVKYLNGGAIQTSGWLHPTNTTGVRILTLSTITGVDDTDLGAAVAGATTGDTGILLGYNTTDKKLWVRCDAADDLFDNTSETINVSGSGAGSMNGSVSVSGENIWSNIFSLGTLVSGTTLDVYQNDGQITPWWSSGHIDILVKVTEAGTEIDSGNLTVLARKYGTLYDHYVIDASSGRNPVPLATFTDANNATAEGTVGAVPYTNITFSFGAKSRNLNNGNGLQPYDVEINCATLTLAQTYEYLKYVTRTGSSTTLNGVNGEFYTAVGDIRLDYTGETSGPFVEGNAITSSAGGSGYIVSLIDNGATGTLVIRNVHGTFADTNTLTSSGTTATISGTPDTITASKQAPFGTFAGGQFFGARGVWITNYAGADANSFTLIDSTGTTQSPPSTIAITVGGVVEGDTVAVFRTTGNNDILDKSMYTSHASSNTSGLGTFTVTTTIAADTPSTGNLRVVDRDAAGAILAEQTYAYTSWSGSVFTLSGTLSQNYNGDDTAYVPFIDGTVGAAATSISVNVTYAADRYVLTRVRKKGIQPFTVQGQVTSSGLSVTAVRTTDSIA